MASVIPKRVRSVNCELTEMKVLFGLPNLAFFRGGWGKIY